MPLNKTALRTAILTALNRNQEIEDADVAVENLATDLANAIEAYVKSGTVKAIVTGVITAGSATTQTQTAPVTAVGNPPTAGIS